MSWIRRLRQQSLRMKLVITALGTAIAVIGASTYLSFGYWRSETVAAAEQQALLAAASVRSSVEAAVSAGDPGRARGSLRELVQRASISGARVYDTTGRIQVSTDPTEEGTRPSGVWIPSPRDVPERGVARPTASGDAVQAYLPLAVGGVAILQVDFSLAPLQAAMDRGARLGLLLLIGSLAAVLLIVSTMLEREVVGPIERVAGMLPPDGGSEGAAGGASSDGAGFVGRSVARSDELRRIETTMTDLIRKEREAEARVAEQERRLEDQAGLAEVGEMAAEMAHEFKRPLASIRSAVGLLEQEYELKGEAQSLLHAVDGQLAKLTETMQDLFALAKPVELAGGRADLAEAVDSALSQLAGLVDTTGRRIHRAYDRRLPEVIGDRHRLEQAVLNVLLNAMEAMGPGGELFIELQREGPDVRLEIRDTGPGIPRAELDRVLLPFYSTKPQGTGLGLPLVARVVAAHRGSMEIESDEGRGTTVRIRLPAAQESARVAAGSTGAAAAGEGAE